MILQYRFHQNLGKTKGERRVIEKQIKFTIDFYFWNVM